MKAERRGPKQDDALELASICTAKQSLVDEESWHCAEERTIMSVSNVTENQRCLHSCTSVSEAIARCKRRAIYEWPVIAAVFVAMAISEAFFRPHRQCVPGLGSHCGEAKDAALNKPLSHAETVSTTKLFLINLAMSLFIFGSSAIYLHFFRHRTATHGGGNDADGSRQAMVECSETCDSVSDIERQPAAGSSTTNTQHFKWSNCDSTQVLSECQCNCEADWRLTALQFERLLRVCALSHALNSLLTNVLKLQTGAPRPNFYQALADDRSKYKDEVRKSFPSGHSSTIFTGAALHFLWLFQSLTAAQLSTGKGKCPRHFASFMWYHLFEALCAKSTALSALFVFWPLPVALTVAATRLTDFWHFPADVSAGAMLGCVVAAAVWRIHTPELNDPL